MFCTDIFFLILTFMSYNYHFEGQNYNLSEFGRYVSQSQVVRSPLQAGQSWSRRAVRSSSGGLEKDRPPRPGRRKGLRIRPARGRHAPLWQRMSPILHNRRVCAKSTKWTTIYSPVSVSTLRVAVSSSCGDSSGLKFAHGTETGRKYKT